MPRRMRIRDNGLKVIHRHRAGDQAFLRVSELAFIHGVPKAVLEWIDMGGTRTPVYLCDLDPEKLRRSPVNHHTYYYRGETKDPRYENVEPARPPR